MIAKFSGNRRNFLKGTIAAAGAVTLGGVIRGSSYNTLAQGLPAQQATPASAGNAPANKMSADLPPLTQEITLHTPQVIKEVAPSVVAEVWTFEGSAPGPILHVKEGEPVKFTLINDSGAMGHSIDFHAAMLPWDKYYQMVPTGEQASFTFTPPYPGAFMYHCGTPPVLMHLGNGMHGAIIVEPKNGWPEKADHEYVLVQHEFYLGDADAQGVRRGDFMKMSAAQPNFVMFNGYANQYKDNPLVANPGELIRIHIVNAGPSTFSAFHVIGTLFIAAYADGNPANKLVGMQTVNIAPGGGYTVELRIPDEGLYPFVTHSFAYTGLGALGIIKVGNPKMDMTGVSH
jgi:nitrite reductase (NO-forming)